MVTLPQLHIALSESWSADTSASPDWSSSNPSLGQCAVTSLVVQDYFGGILLRSRVSGVSHYWNMLPDGREIDFTKDQFKSYDLDEPLVDRSRAYVLSFPATAVRYSLLVERVSFNVRLLAS